MAGLAVCRLPVLKPGHIGQDRLRGTLATGMEPAFSQARIRSRFRAASCKGTLPKMDPAPITSTSGLRNRKISAIRRHRFLHQVYQADIRIHVERVFSA